ncbi:Hypothetical predicted protein, partial [Marmota monax]
FCTRRSTASLETPDDLETQRRPLAKKDGERKFPPPEVTVSQPSVTLVLTDQDSATPGERKGKDAWK